MRIRLDKIASCTRNVGLFRDVTLGSEIPAEAGVVIAVRVLDNKSSYNHVEDAHGRMMRVQAGDAWPASWARGMRCVAMRAWCRRRSRRAISCTC
jgi:hypothetical protein